MVLTTIVLYGVIKPGGFTFYMFIHLPVLHLQFPPPFNCPSPVAGTGERGEHAHAPSGGGGARPSDVRRAELQLGKVPWILRRQVAHQLPHRSWDHSTIAWDLVGSGYIWMDLVGDVDGGFPSSEKSSAW